MGHRLSKIVTRTGDAGTTGLGDGSRVPKDSARIEAIGAVDELNSCVGAVLVEALPDDVRELLTDVQHDLFDLGGELSIPGHDEPFADRKVAALADREPAALVGADRLGIVAVHVQREPLASGAACGVRDVLDQRAAGAGAVMARQHVEPVELRRRRFRPVPRGEADGVAVDPR